MIPSLPSSDGSSGAQPRSAGCGLTTAIGIAILVLLVFAASQVGVYTVQPIGALPEGITLVVWRSSGTPFFDSPDALCLRAQDGVSLLCRAMALGYAPKDRIILRLPYMEWAYLASTGGKSFER